MTPPPMRRFSLATAAALCVAAPLGCERRDDLDGRRRPIAGLEQTADPSSAPEVGEGELAFDFIDNRAAALVYTDGALTASGRGIGFALLSRGGEPAQWQLGKGAKPTARVNGQVAHIHFPFDSDPGGIKTSRDQVPVTLRFHPAARNQLASVFLNDTKVGDVPMAEVGTAEYRIDVPRALFRPGENDLRLFFRYATPDARLRTAGALERIAIGGGSAPATGAVKVAPIERGGRRLEAISSARALRLSFHTLVPARRPRLALSVAGAGAPAIYVARGSGGSREIWRGEPSQEWKQQTIDLSEFAGELVRIDFVGSGALDWARPQIVADAGARASPASSAAAAHVIVWIVSGMRADSIAEGGPMPALRALASAGQHQIAIARTPIAGISAAEILAGRSFTAAPIAASIETLAERFADAGYRTALFSNAPAISGDNQGFARVVRAQNLDAATLWQRAQANLKANASVRTLTVLFTNEPALPWAPEASRVAPEWRSYSGRVLASATRSLAAQLRGGAAPLSARDRDYVAALYRGELATVDSAIATMTADLAALGIASDTGVIVVGDRSQVLEASAFGEPTSLSSDGRLVPLVVVAKSRPAAAAARRLVVTADAFATALDLGQISLPQGSDGRSLFTAAQPGRAVLMRWPARARGIATAEATYIESAAGERLLLRRGADGSEVAQAPDEDLVAARALITWMSILTAATPWDSRRWGRASSLRPAFSSELGGF